MSRTSEAASAAVEAIGGKVNTVYYNQLGLRALLKPWKFAVLPKRAMPPPRLQRFYPDMVAAAKEQTASTL